MSDCHQGALCFLIRIVSYDPKFKEVFRDVGVLEVLTYCLKQYATDLKEKRDGKFIMDMLILIGASIIYVPRKIHNHLGKLPLDQQ